MYYCDSFFQKNENTIEFNNYKYIIQQVYLTSFILLDLDFIGSCMDIVHQMNAYGPQNQVLKQDRSYCKIRASITILLLTNTVGKKLRNDRSIEPQDVLVTGRDGEQQDEEEEEDTDVYEIMSNHTNN